ncbi:hypothetical protein GCE9029_04577 [Grimontia celer]|uniref:Uncharacterized protein n=2 Tax=Grimontia celer TaxID=1796497 RepID=A0A128FEJ5_9GAMM|nr:hypothetical protein GCE9029_04577 [Grimontia celer]
MRLDATDASLASADNDAGLAGKKASRKTRKCVGFAAITANCREMMQVATIKINMNLIS